MGRNEGRKWSQFVVLGRELETLVCGLLKKEESGLFWARVATKWLACVGG